jgi:hypothetical protein
MSKSTTINHAFQGWKMWLGVFIGLTVVIWMLYKSVTTISYVEVVDGSGKYEWVDSNHNQKVDLHLPNEFLLMVLTDHRPSPIPCNIFTGHFIQFFGFYSLLFSRPVGIFSTC